MRLFVAIELPDRVKEQLGEVVAELNVCGADVRWIRPDSMHLTLKFLGNVEPGELAAIDEVLSRVAGAAPPARIRLRDLGSFPHLRRPRVLWVGVEADEALGRIHAATDDALCELGFARERRGFRPHVTIGRVRSEHGLDELRRAFEARRSLETEAFDVGRLTLFESELHRKGADYTAVSEYRLGTGTRK